MTTRQTIKRFYEPYKVSRLATILLIIRAIYTISYNLFAVKYFQIAVKAVENQSYEQLQIYSMIFFVCTIIFYSLKPKEKTRIFKAITDYSIYLDIKYLGKFLQSSNQATEKMGVGRMQHIFKNGIFNWVDLLVNCVSDYLIILLSLLTSLIYIGFINIYLLLVAFGIIGIALLIILPFNHKAKKRRIKTKQLQMEVDRLFIRRMMSKWEILQNQQYNYESQQDTKLNNQWLGYKIKEKTSQSIGFDGAQFLIATMFIGFIFFFGKMTITGEYPVDVFVLLFGLLQIIIQNTQRSNEVIRRVFDGWIHVSKLWDTFDQFQPLMGYSNGPNFNSNGGSFKLENVNYGYTDDQLIFIDFSLNIAGGSRIALVGPSGGGKSTLVKLIAGYLHPQSGQIFVDGQALPTPQNIESGEHISLQSYYPHIGYLTQEPSVFDGTVWENLTYGLQEDTNEQDKLEDHINHIIKLARCEFVHEFKDGLQTEIGEKGVRLSGGQRQRLAIAKIMLKDPDIILLDEPTSALDSENEELVTQALNELFRGKTVIVIAHRLQTVKHADQILYIDDGQIIESGTHQELLDLKGNYYTMVELQSGF